MTLTRTVRIPLSLTHEDIAKFAATVSVAHEFYAQNVDYMLETKTINKSKLHHNLYQKQRELHPEFPSALLQATRDLSVEGLRSAHSNHPKKRWAIRPRLNGKTLRLDARTFSVRGNQLTFSTVGKRIKTIICIPTWFVEKYPSFVMTSSASISVDKKNRVFLNLVFEDKNPVSAVGNGKVIGVDRGIYSLATTSEGVNHSGKKTRATKRRFAYNRKVLQQKGTRSAHKRLKAMSGSEKRFMQDTNHVISKALVETPDLQTIVLEQLAGIRKRTRSKKMNNWLNTWSYYQLEQFIKYKAEAVGVTVTFIDPRYTSQDCSTCGVRDKKSRKGNKYKCSSCGFTAHADLNAADQYS